MRLFVLLAFCLAVASCKNEQNEPASAQHTKSADESRFDCKTFAVDGGWGYDIYVDGELYVHQEHIPAINGTHPFVSEADAWNTGSFAVRKMKDGIVPPTITVENMQALGIVLPPQN